MGSHRTALPGKKSDPGKTAKDNRLFLEAVLWIVRTGSLWRDLPQESGNRNSVYRRCRRRVQEDVFENIFTRPNTDADCEYNMTDGTIVKTHRHGQGAKGGVQTGSRPLQRRDTAKIPALTDASGNSCGFTLPPGRRNGICGVRTLLEGKSFGALPAAKPLMPSGQ